MALFAVAAPGTADPAGGAAQEAARETTGGPDGTEAAGTPASAFGDRIGSLEDFVTTRLSSRGRAGENAEVLAAFREQKERGLIDEEQYAEAVRALGAEPLTLDGRPFTGTVHGGRVEATFAEGRLTRVLFRAADGRVDREIVDDGGTLRETRFWGGPFGRAPRRVTVYRDAWMGPATTRVLTPDGELVHETGPDGGLRQGPGWIGGVNMWQEDNPFYRRVEACEPAKLYVNGSRFEVVGPREGGCAVRYGHWASPDPARPDLAGTSMVCVHRAGSAYDFIAALHGQGVPNETCRGTLADALGRRDDDR